MENNVKNIISFASKGNASKVRESIFTLLGNKLKLALNARKVQLAKESLSGANDVKKNK